VLPTVDEALAISNTRPATRRRVAPGPSLDAAATRARRAAWHRRRRRLLAYGRWAPQEVVEPSAARAHVEMLRGQGLSLEAVAELAGVSSSVVAALVYPAHAGFRSWITPATEQAILDTRVDLALVGGTRRVPSVGTRRRIEALCRLGWPLSALGKELGVSKEAVSSLRTRPTVTAAKARAVRDLYDRLCTVQGPSTRARRAAEAAGWAPPLAWDEQAIDDPNSTPTLESGMSRLEVVEEVQFLLSCGRGAAEIAQLLHSTPVAVARALQRERHPELALMFDALVRDSAREQRRGAAA
jgi:hypothetical protein